MKSIAFQLFLVLIFVGCQAQTQPSTKTQHIGGPCEGCEAIYEYGDQELSNCDTLPSFFQNENPLKIEGTVFQLDGKTPANNTIIYIYHTNDEGLYVAIQEAKDWGQRHGKLRAWLKTSKDGKYCLYTSRPASYPNRDEPEHIHITVKEEGRNEYYIDEIVFDDDPLLTEVKRKELKSRGGSGIVSVANKDGLDVVNRDIILGLNIPDYY